MVYVNQNTFKITYSNIVLLGYGYGFIFQADFHVYD